MSSACESSSWSTVGRMVESLRLQLSVAMLRCVVDGVVARAGGRKLGWCAARRVERPRLDPLGPAVLVRKRE